MKKLLLIISLFSITLVSAGENMFEIVNVLKQVESLGDTKAIGDNGKAFGILQIHKVYVDEVNMRYSTDYTHEQMFDEICSEEVFMLYMQYASNRFCSKYKRYPNEQEIVRMHNGGLYYGYKRRSTEKYYLRYLKFKRRIYNV